MATRIDSALAAISERIDSLLDAGVRRLPPESELAIELGVSRATLRQALAELERDGILRRQRKVGTSILRGVKSDSGVDRDIPVYPLDVIWSFPDFFERAGLPYDIESVSVTAEGSDAATAQQLEIDEGTIIYRVRRVFRVQGARAIVAEHCLPQIINGRRTRIEGLTRGIASYLREIEMIDITRVEHRVSAILADQDRAREMDVRRADPLLRVRLRLRAGSGDAATTIVVGTLIINPAAVEVGATAAAP